MSSANEYPQHMFLWRIDENYPSIIIKYPPYLFHCMCPKPVDATQSPFNRIFQSASHNHESFLLSNTNILSISLPHKISASKLREVLSSLQKYGLIYPYLHLHWTSIPSLGKQIYCNDPKFSDRQVWVKCEVPDQGLFCLPVYLHLLDPLLHVKATLLKF